MRVIGWALCALLSHWRKHPVQGIALFTGLWLATALLTGVQALNSQARQSYALASQLIGGQTQASLSRRDGGPLEQQLFIDLRLQGWPVSPALQGQVELVARPGERLELLGIEPMTLPRGTALAGEVPSVEQLSAFIGAPGRTWIAASTLEALGLAPGDQPLMRNGQALPPLEVRAQMAPGTLLVDIGAAQRLLQAPQQLTRLLLPADLERPLPAALAATLQLNRNSTDGDLARLTESFHLNLTALGLLAFAVGLFIVHAAIGLALEQRRPLLRTLRGCGVSARQLILALAVELSVLALVAGVAGIASGYGLASLLLPDVAASLRGLYGAQIAGHLSLSPAWWLAGLGLSLSGAAVAGGSSLWRAARMPLLALAGNEAWHQAYQGWLRRQAWVAAAAAVIALLAGLWGDSLASGFVLIGSLLLAAALGLPVLLNQGLQALGRPTRGVLGQWFIADCRQQLPGLSLALMALLLALAANIGAGSMTEGFRQTFNGWLEQRLSAQLYVRPPAPEQSAELQRWLQDQRTIDGVLPTWELQMRPQGWPAELVGIEDDRLYREHWPLLQAAGPNPWDRVFTQDAVMLSEQLARRLRLTIGDRLELPAATGQWQAQVVGIYADYGNPKGHALVAAAHLREHWPDQPPARFALRLEPSQVSDVKQRLQQRFALDPAHLVEQSQLKTWATQVFERTFSATSALNTLTLGVAGVALFISLLTQSQSRLGQLAPLWAMGVPRRTLMLLNLAQTWLLAVLTLLLALPLGLLLAWCLVAVINVQAFGWRLPLQVFPLQLLRLGGLALLATLLASAWPLYRLWRSQPTDLLRVMGDER